MKRKLDQSEIENCSSDKNKWNRIIIDKDANIVGDNRSYVLSQIYSL